MCRDIFYLAVITSSPAFLTLSSISRFFPTLWHHWYQNYSTANSRWSLKRQHVFIVGLPKEYSRSLQKYLSLLEIPDPPGPNGWLSTLDQCCGTLWTQQCCVHRHYVCQGLNLGLQHVGHAFPQPFELFSRPIVVLVLCIDFFHLSILPPIEAPRSG